MRYSEHRLLIKAYLNADLQPDLPNSESALLVTLAHAQSPVPPKSDEHSFADEPYVMEQLRTSVRLEADGKGQRETTLRIRVHWSLPSAMLIVAGWLLARWGFTRDHSFPAAVPISLGFAMSWTGICFFLGSFLLMASSYYGKFHARDRLLDGLRLAGDETLLEVGCGHGLLLIGAAKRLPRGRAVGIDLWSQVDQGNNSKEATLGNAELEGVADRVEIHTGDMRQMPFADATFDAVVANPAIHNVPSREGRRQAISEIVRVLTPGGRVALMDFKKTGDYASDLRALGLTNARAGGPIFWIFPPVRIARGQKPG